MRLRTMAVMMVLLGGVACAQPLLDYVNAPDDSYAWSLAEEPTHVADGTLSKLNLTSQTWQGITWTHALWLMIPDETDVSTCLLVVTGGDPSAEFVMLGSTIASQAKAPVAVLWNIPNQPLYDGKVEDALIAHTFVKYLDTGDASWPLLIPMAKAAVRAMDALEEYAAGDPGTEITGFVVSGASKRGWTTWMTAAADDRVVGIAPMVYDNLNLPAQMAHQREVYEGYSEQISEYTEFNLQDMLQTPEGAALGEAVDPYSFRERLTMPKLIINGSNDPYWTLQSPDFYFRQLPGENSIHYSPNAGHDLGGVQPALTRIVPTAVAFLRHCGGAGEWPKLEWEALGVIELETLIVHITSDIEPTRVSAWTTVSEDMDFRDETWEMRGVDKTDNGWTFTLENPRGQHAAAFGEVEYLIDGRKVILSTTPAVWPLERLEAE